MNRRLIVRILGALLGIEGLAMIPSLILSFVFRDGDSSAMMISTGVVLLLGGILFGAVRSEDHSHLRLKEGYIIVAMGWILMGLCGSLPFLLSGVLPRFEDAFFETVSGLTTTGASVVRDFDHFPRGVMFWRATTHWIGGMGVLVLTLALLPKLTGRTAHLVKAESPGPSLSKIVPKTGTTAKILYRIYIALTLLEVIALLLCGLNPYDAVIHAFATAGTGGFSNYGASISAFNSAAVEMVIALFMFMFGINFALYYKFLIGEHFRAFWKDEEFRWYLTLGVSFILLISVINLPYYHHNMLTSLRYGIFQVFSVMSTTGFVTADFNQWPASSQILLLVIMFIGSCAGSTAGGMKVIRVNMLCKLSRRNILSTGNPKKMEVIRLDGKAVDEQILSQVAQFSFMYIALVLLGAFLISVDSSYDAVSNISASLTCVSNVGPGLGAVGPVENFAGLGPFAKMISSLLMLFGRLELIPMFILFTRSAWHKY